MSAKHPIGVAENFFKFKADNSVELDLQPLKEIFEHPEVKDRKIVVLSVVGAFRQGKSFFLDYCLRFLYENYRSIKYPGNPLSNSSDWMGEETDSLIGFSWCPGVTRDTSGLLIWNDAFLHTNEKNEDIAIFLVDSHGLFDNITTTSNNLLICALACLFSSVLVFNVSELIQEEQLRVLNFAAEYAEFNHLRKENGDNKPFQKLTFLLRDWVHQSEYENGFKGGERYLSEVLATFDGQDEELKSIREHIREAFETIDCSLIPFPGNTVATCMKNCNESYNGNFKEMRSNFRAHLFEAVEHLLKPEQLVLKKFNGMAVTCAEFYQSMLEILNSIAIK